jgi:pseudaminic acid synthase
MWNIFKINLFRLKKLFSVGTSLSDHTLGIVAPVVAVTLGARVIEKHFILDKSIGGSDASFSLDEKEFAEMVEAVRQAEKAVGKISYELTEKVKASRKFARPLFVVKDIKAGEKFTEKNVRSIRPGFGLHPKYLKEIIGKTTKENIAKGTPLKNGDFYV